jgi:hypothetical protein
MKTFLKNLWDRIVFRLNKMLGEPSMEQMAKETNDDFDAGQGRIKEGMAESGEKLGIMKLQVAILGQTVEELDRQLRTHLKRMQGLNGLELQAAERERDFRVKTLAKSQGQLAEATAKLERAMGRQNAAKFMAQDFAVQRQMARLETSMYVQEDKLLDIEEELLEAQMSAVGAMSSSIRDHRGKMRERNAGKQGRIEGLEDFLEANMAAQGQAQLGQQVVLSDKEQALLDDAMARAGVTPAQSEDQSAQSAS